MRINGADGGGSSRNGEVKILPCLAITATLSGSTTICEGNSTDLAVSLNGGETPYSLVYSPNGGATTVPVSDYQSGGLIAVSPTAQTTYTLISAGDANGCPANVGGNATVTVNPLPTATVSGGGAVCAGQPLPNVSIALTGMAPFTFTYSNGSSSTPVAETATNPYMIANAPARSYTVTSLSAANCTGTSFSGSATVTVNEGLNKVELRLGSLPTGIYLIRAIDALNQQGVVRVGKQ